MSGESSSYWKRHVHRYDRVTLVLNRRFTTMTGRLSESIRGFRRVLEVGAGTGLVSARIAPVVGHLVATDLSSEMLSVLRTRMEAEGLTNVDVEAADALRLHFADRSFDAVVVANLLHLLPDPGQALAEARRVLGPAGLLAAPTFCHGETAIARFVSRLLGLTGFEVVTRFAGGDLRDLVGTCGFTVHNELLFPGLLPIRLVLAGVAHRERSRAGASTSAPSGERREDDSVSE